MLIKKISDIYSSSEIGRNTDYANTLFYLQEHSTMCDNHPFESLLALVTAMAFGAVLFASVQKYGEMKAANAKRDAGIRNDTAS